MKKNIAIIIGHPNPDSYCAALAASYIKGAQRAGADVRTVDLARISFNPNLKNGYSKRTELEPDLLEAQRLISWADHLVFVYPTWWGAMPALLKGFIDRTFLPGFAFKYRPNSSMWDKLLTGKTARLIITSDTPWWYNKLMYGEAGFNVMKRNILHFCGVKPVRIMHVGPVKPSSDKERAVWFDKTTRLGERHG